MHVSMCTAPFVVISISTPEPTAFSVTSRSPSTSVAASLSPLSALRLGSSEGSDVIGSLALTWRELLLLFEDLFLDAAFDALPKNSNTRHTHIERENGEGCCQSERDTSAACPRVVR